LMPLVQHHLDTCDDCREEYKVLASILYGTT
jgi:predicted anti-sigma-YlaC factor YlaD